MITDNYSAINNSGYTRINEISFNMNNRGEWMSAEDPLIQTQPADVGDVDAAAGASPSPGTKDITPDTSTETMDRMTL